MKNRTNNFATVDWEKLRQDNVSQLVAFDPNFATDSESKNFRRWHYADQMEFKRWASRNYHINKNAYYFDGEPFRSGFVSALTGDVYSNVIMTFEDGKASWAEVAKAIYNKVYPHNGICVPETKRDF